MIVTAESDGRWNENSISVLERGQDLDDMVLVCIHEPNTNPLDGATILMERKEFARLASMIAAGQEL